jgi:hypothetical protein
MLNLEAVNTRWYRFDTQLSSEQTSCAFNTFIQSLPSAWSLVRTMERSNIHNSTETRQRPNIDTDQPLVQYGQTIWEANFKKNPHNTEKRNLCKIRSIWHSSRSQYDTLMYEAGGSRHHNFNNNMSTAAVFLGIEKVFDTTWRSGLVHKFPAIEFRQVSLNQLFLSSFIHQWIYSPLLGPGLFFSFVILFAQTVGLLGRVISSSQGRYLHTG